MKRSGSSEHAEEMKQTPTEFVMRSGWAGGEQRKFLNSPKSPKQKRRPEGTERQDSEAPSRNRQGLAPTCKEAERLRSNKKIRKLQSRFAKFLYYLHRNIFGFITMRDKTYGDIVNACFRHLTEVLHRNSSRCFQRNFSLRNSYAFPEFRRRHIVQ